MSSEPHPDDGAVATGAGRDVELVGKPAHHRYPQPGSWTINPGSHSPAFVPELEQQGFGLQPGDQRDRSRRAPDISMLRCVICGLGDRDLDVMYAVGVNVPVGTKSLNQASHPRGCFGGREEGPLLLHLNLVVGLCLQIRSPLAPWSTSEGLFTPRNAQGHSPETLKKVRRGLHRRRRLRASLGHRVTLRPR
jgi:hypothetical protein